MGVNFRLQTKDCFIWGDKTTQEARILLIPVQKVVTKVKPLGNINLPQLLSSNKDVRVVAEMYAHDSVERTAWYV